MNARDLANTATPAHEALVEKLVRAAKRKMTSDEIFEQEVSYVYGNMPSRSDLTKDDVRKYLLERRGG